MDISQNSLFSWLILQTCRIWIFWASSKFLKPPAFCPSMFETCQFPTLSLCDDRQQTGCETVKIRSTWCRKSPAFSFWPHDLAVKMSCDKSERLYFKGKQPSFLKHMPQTVLLKWTLIFLKSTLDCRTPL